MSLTASFVTRSDNSRTNCTSDLVQTSSTHSLLIEQSAASLSLSRSVDVVVDATAVTTSTFVSDVFFPSGTSGGGGRQREHEV